MTAIMVLAAGLGTRLKPLTDELPKPLVPIGDRAAVLHVIERARAGAGVSARVVVNSHHFAEVLEAALVDARVSVSHEPELLGTAGGVAHARALLGEGDVLVWNADILAELDAGALLLAHTAHRVLGSEPARATLVVRQGAEGSGNVGWDDEGRIVRLRKESFGAESHSGEFLGIHVIGAALREALPAVGCLVGDVYLPALRRGDTLAAFVTEAPFVDVGSPSAYAEANRAWLARSGQSSYVGPGASVDIGIALTDSIVGAGARVVGSGELARVVVWPGAVAEAPLADAIVTPRTLLRLGPAS